MVLGHSNNVELSATNIILGGTSSGLTAMTVKYFKPRIMFFYSHRVKSHDETDEGLRRKSTEVKNKANGSDQLDIKLNN